MSREFAKSFYASSAWINTRQAYAKSVGGLCESCLKSGLINAGEIVHHKIPITEDNIDNPNITLAWENLRLLCRYCHGEEHKKKAGYVFDENGNVCPRC